MMGGAGDDSYVVNNRRDTVSEDANEGTDTVISSVSYALGANIENLTLTGGEFINGAGNDLNNVLTGNRVRNRLDGGAGADTMAGGKGNDTYVVDDVGDTVSENASEGTGHGPKLGELCAGRQYREADLDRGWGHRRHGPMI